MRYIDVQWNISHKKGENNAIHNSVMDLESIMFSEISPRKTLYAIPDMLNF